MVAKNPLILIAMKASNFILYYSQWPALKSLSVQELGELLQAIFRTLGDEDVEDVANSLDEKVQIAFRFLMVQINYDNEKYQKKCEKNKQNAMKRWSKNANDATAFFAMPNNNNNNNSNTNTNSNININSNINSNNRRRDSSSSSVISEKAANEEEDEEEDSLIFEKAEKQWLPWFNKLLDDNASAIPRMRKMTMERAKAMKSLADKYGNDALLEVLRRAAQNSFLNGRSKRSNFVADIDWLLKEENFMKVYENKFFIK